MLVSSGYISQVDEINCIGCGACAETCQFNAITVNQFAYIDREICMGCGLCLAHCEQEAITLMRDPAKSPPLEILNLLESAR